MVNELAEIIGLFKLGYTRQALKFLNKILTKNKNKQNHKDIINKLYTYTQDIIKQKNYTIAIQLLQILEEISLETKDASKLCDIKNNLSLCYRLCNCINESLTKCLEALEIVTQNFEIRSKLPALHLNACAIYREDLNDLSNAKTHAELAYYFAKETYCPLESYKRTLAVSIYNYGFICDEINDFKNAEKWYNEGLKFCQEEWNDQSFIDNIRIKLRSLDLKLRLINKRVKCLDIPELEYSTRRDSSVHSPYKNHAKARRLISSQCSRRTKPNSLNDSTPIPRISISSHEKSTENSLNSHESVFKTRNLRLLPSPPKRMILKNSKNLSVTRLVDELCDKRFAFLENVIKIQKYFKGYLIRKKYKLQHNITAKRVIFNHRLFIIFVEFFTTSITIEAFNTESIMQIAKYSLSNKDVCNMLNFPYSDWKIYKKKLADFVSIDKRKIVLKNKDEVIIYEGINYISGEKCNVVIKFIDEKKKSIKIISKNDKKINTCAFSLDSLQDPENIKKKIPFILSKLKMKDGELVFSV